MCSRRVKPVSGVDGATAALDQRLTGCDRPAGGTPMRSLHLLAADCQSLAPFCTAALEDQSPVLGLHSHQEAVRFHAPAAIRLKRAFALHWTCAPRTGSRRSSPLGMERTANVSEPFWRVSTSASLCYSSPPSNDRCSPQRIPKGSCRLVSHQTFPQLWKKLWKFQAFVTLRSPDLLFEAHFGNFFPIRH